MVDPGTGAREDRGLNLRWPTLTGSLAAVAASSLAALAVVASVKHADTLSTVALALAILSFTAQLIIALFQTIAGARQVVDAERANSQAKATLTEIRTVVASLLANQEHHVAKLLDLVFRVLPDAVRDAVEEDAIGGAALGENGTRLDLDTISAAVAERVESEVRAAGEGTSSMALLSAGASAEQRRMIRAATTYPDSSEGQRLLEVLRTLASHEWAFLARRATEEVERLRAGELAGDWFCGDPGTSAGRQLVELGLMSLERRARPTAKNPDEWFFRQLTPEGRRVAALLLGRGARPSWLAEAFGTLPGADGNA
jgi:hypothetical protein